MAGVDEAGLQAPPYAVDHGATFAGGAAFEHQQVHFQDLAHALTVPISKDRPSLGRVSVGFLAPEPNLRHAADVSLTWNTWGPS